MLLKFQKRMSEHSNNLENEITRQQKNEKGKGPKNVRDEEDIPDKLVARIEQIVDRAIQRNSASRSRSRRTHHSKSVNPSVHLSNHPSRKVEKSHPKPSNDEESDHGSNTDEGIRQKFI